MKLAPFVALWVVGIPIALGAYVVFVEPDADPGSAPPRLLKNAPAPVASARPKLVTDRREHDFGTQSILSSGDCRFSIRNEGSGPLRLGTPPPTAGRLAVALSEKHLKPGDVSIVSVRWQTAKIPATFDAQAIVTSDDPENSHVVFRVHGEVKSELVCVPATIATPDISPERTETVRTLALSHVWDAMQITDLSCTNPALKLDVAHATSEQLHEFSARSGKVISITFPAGLPHGRFQETVRFVGVSPDGSSKPLEVPVSGRVLRRLALYGEHIEFTGVVNLGVVRVGESKTVRILMKVRDPQRELVLKSWKVHPEFVEVRMNRLEGNTAAEEGLYHLELTVPATAPPANFDQQNGHEMGTLRMEFDHPRIQDLDLKLFLTVEPKPQ